MGSEMKICGRSRQMLVQKIADETLIYDLAADKALCLNKTSSVIWEMCDGTKTAEEIALAASRRLKSDVSADLVWLALEQFEKDNLLENEIDNPLFGTAAEAKGSTRREAIKKIGMASMIALPLVASIAVPTSIRAQGSCVPEGGACTDDADCCRGFCNSNSCVNVLLV